MIYVDHKITLDVRKVASPVFVRLKKKDSARRILAYLTEKSRPYQITEDCYAVFTAKKPDGKVIFNDCTIDGNTIIYEVTDQTTAAVGQFEAEIKLYGRDGKLITSPCFTIVVADTVYDEGDEIESTDEYNALAALIERVQSLETTSALICKAALPMVALEGMTVQILLENFNRTPKIGEVFNAICGKRYTILEVVGVTDYTCAAKALASVEIESGGISKEEKSLILALFKGAAYTADMSAKVTELEALWSVNYKVEYSLTGATASNGASAVIENGAYTTTLTAEIGYTLTGATVKVTMGGKDITSTAYNNGVISIPSVTGAVVITVVAKEVPSYTIANNLTNVTTDNSATKVTEGDFYSASLSWEAGFALNSIVITMGGVDITADVYGEGSILITEVTGDVVITAEAALPPAVFTLSEPVDLGGEIVDTSFAPFAEVKQENSAFSICIDLSITAVANAAYKDFVRVAGLKMQYYGWAWNVFWNAAAKSFKDGTGKEITGNTGPNGKFILTKESASSSLTMYYHNSDTLSTITPTGQGQISDDTLKFNLGGAGVYSGSIREFVWYDRVLTADEIKAYFGEV